ncbi:hypothetical protein M3Y99_00474500 [Aphelenchoides fujianensis]|nr:hypothetical protein M3Y99_00474500 [Aphelenchoides fujianensis]
MSDSSASSSPIGSPADVKPAVAPDLSSSDSDGEREEVGQPQNNDAAAASSNSSSPSMDEGEREQIEAIQQALNESDEELNLEPMEFNDVIPPCRIDTGEMGPVHVRLPNFLSIDPSPFDERTYHLEVDEEEALNEEGQSRMKLKVENTIRWRNVHDPETGEVKRESNAKIVKWSDGSMSLYMGAEIFEIQDQPSLANIHLYTRLDQNLTAQSPFARKFTFRPHSTETLTHRKMTLSMADKSNRTQKVKMVTDVGMNPEKDRKEKVRREEEKMRADNRKQAARRRTRERNREAGISSGFLEGDESDEGESVGAIKRAYGAGGGVLPAYYSDDSEEDEQSRRAIRDAKFIESDDEEESQGPSHREAPKRRIIEEEDDDE